MLNRDLLLFSMESRRLQGDVIAAFLNLKGFVRREMDFLYIGR